MMKDYLKSLNKAIKENRKEMTAFSYNRVLAVIAIGIKENFSLICPSIIPHKKEPGVMEWFYVGSKRYLAAYSYYKYINCATSHIMKIQGIAKLICEDRMCEGLVINPDSENAFYVDRDLLSLMINTGYEVLKHELLSERQTEILEDMNINEILLQPPISEYSFRHLARRIETLPNTQSFAVHLDHGEDYPETIELEGKDDRILMSIVSFSYLFGKEKVFVYSGELERQKAIDALKMICVYDENYMNADGILEQFGDHGADADMERRYLEYWNNQGICFGEIRDIIGETMNEEKSKRALVTTFPKEGLSLDDGRCFGVPIDEDELPL